MTTRVQKLLAAAKKIVALREQRLRERERERIQYNEALRQTNEVLRRMRNPPPKSKM